MNEWLSDRQLDEIVIEVVGQMKTQYGISETCTGEQACHKMGLELRRGPLPRGTEGMTTGQTIVVNQKITWPPRVEFTIFHEITHHVLDEDGQHYEHYTAALRRNDLAFKAAIERACDRGAAEFLMPRHLVRAAISDRGFSVELIGYLASTFGASIVAAAIQLATCAPIECYVLLCVYGVRPRGNPPQTTLYAEYVAAPWSARYPLARYCAIPKDHLCYQVWQERLASKGRSFVPFPSGRRMPCYAEALCLQDRRVAAVLSLGQLPSPGQSLLVFPESGA